MQRWRTRGILKRIDDTPVWSVVCFFVIKEFRKQGVMLACCAAPWSMPKRKALWLSKAIPIDMQSQS